MQQGGMKMNETCVMCGAELPTEHINQYCKECEEKTTPEQKFLKTGGNFKNERIKQAILPKG